MFVVIPLRACFFLFDLWLRDIFEVSMEKMNKKNVSKAATKVCGHSCDLLAQQELLIPLLHETFIQLSSDTNVLSE